MSAGFTLTTVTEPDTSTAGTKTGDGEGTFAQLAIYVLFQVFVRLCGGAGGGHTNGSSAGGGQSILKEL